MKDGYITYKEHKFTVRVYNEMIRFFYWYIRTSDFIKDIRNIKFNKRTKVRHLKKMAEKYDIHEQNNFNRFIAIYFHLDYYNNLIRFINEIYNLDKNELYEEFGYIIDFNYNRTVKYNDFYKDKFININMELRKNII